MFFQITWTQSIEQLEVKIQKLKLKSVADKGNKSGVCGTKKAEVDSTTSC